MATFVLQALGCDVSSINTVAFSNHTAYKQFKGRRTPADEIQAIYDGLKQNELTNFDVLLSGYTGSKDAVETVGGIGRDLKLHAGLKPGSFFWILDPVMGDNGKIYVAEDIVPVYRTLVGYADLILPNCFEAELLSEIKITDLASLTSAITKLHKERMVPHIIVTSVSISPKTGRRSQGVDELHVVGSSCTSDNTPRLWSITVPALPIFFSGTGDMFAALMVVRLREAVAEQDPALFQTRAWLPPDSVPAAELPLARAAERVLASMHTVLLKTAAARAQEIDELNLTGAAHDSTPQRLHARQTRAAEIRVVQCVDDLRRPQLTQPDGLTFRAEPIAT